MKIVDCLQYSEKWWKVRAGIPTASQAFRIITPKEHKKSAQIDKYAMELAAERWIGRALERGLVTAAMAEGSEKEEQAVNAYAFSRQVDPIKIGFMTNDAGTIGASPDRLIKEVKLLECKAPICLTHVCYLLGEGPEWKYFAQLQMQLLVAELDTTDIISFYPGMPDKIVEQGRNEEFIRLLFKYLDDANELVSKYYDKLISAYGSANTEAVKEAKKESVKPAPYAQKDPFADLDTEAFIKNLREQGKFQS